MAVTFTFTTSGGSETTVTVTPVNGTLKLGGGSDDRGGGKIPAVRAGISENGSLQVVLASATAENKNHTLAELKSLVSPVGMGDREISGTVNGVSFESHEALVDVKIEGDSVQVATISWKGTYADETQSNG